MTQPLSLKKLQAYAPVLFTELRKRGILKGGKTKAEPAAGDVDPEFELALVPNERLRELKKELLQKDVPIVDVLAFPGEDFPNPESGRRYLGEVYINEDIAREDFPRAIFLFVHGILHLLGYRHEEKRDIIVMESLEHELHHMLLSK